MANALATLPVVDLSLFLGKDAADPAAQDACRLVAQCLRDTGALIVRDPRVSQEANAAFLDTMEAYFGQPVEAKMEDVRADLSYQARGRQHCAATPRRDRAC